MVEETRGTKAMNSIMAIVHPTMKDLGFRKRKNAFNRTTDDGLTHVVHFQRGQKPGTHDEFTVNVGVFIPAAFLVTHPSHRVPAFINEFDCQIRQRIGFVIDNRDIWWSLAQEKPEELGEKLCSYINGAVLDWIRERAHSKEVMLDFYERSDGHRWEDRAMAMVAVERGEKERAERFLQRTLDAIASMHRTDDRETMLHQGWIDQLRHSHIKPFGLDVTYPVIESD